ncbi:hypothetical protein AB0C74_31170 [Spirillospora sp. NPDC048832]
MTEQTHGDGPEGAEGGANNPEEGTSPLHSTPDEPKHPGTDEEFSPDSTEGRGGRPEDLNPDDFE